jgi:hypothetical protein
MQIEPVDERTQGWTEEALAVAERLFFHAVAVMWSSQYRDDNAAALRQDWPRIPIPGDRTTLAASGDLGRRVADLLLPDRPVPGVTTGRLRAELRGLGVPTRKGGGAIDPDTDLRVDAGWGFFGSRRAVMCGKGKIEVHAGDSQNALDVYINDRVYWANVPRDVWTLTVGGYPVLKKWLSYREFKVLGRPLRLEEFTYVTEVVRRLKALLLLREELDANYLRVLSNTLELAN